MGSPTWKLSELCTFGGLWKLSYLGMMERSLTPFSMLLPSQKKVEVGSSRRGAVVNESD